MPPKKKKVSVPLWLVILGAVAPVATWVGGMAMNAWTIAGNIATKTELSDLRRELIDGFKKTDETIARTLEAAKVYSDEKAKGARDEAINHADQNRLANLAEIKALAAELKGIQNTQNMTLEVVRSIQADQLRRGK